MSIFLFAPLRLSSQQIFLGIKNNGGAFAPPSFSPSSYAYAQDVMRSSIFSLKYYFMCFSLARLLCHCDENRTL